jgi:hypothetical protein
MRGTAIAIDRVLDIDRSLRTPVGTASAGRLRPTCTLKARTWATSWRPT